MYRNNSFNQQNSSDQHYINIAGSNQKSTWQPGSQNLVKRYLLPLPSAWGLQPHHQIKLPNMGSVPLPLAKAVNMETKQPQLQTQHSLSNQSQLLFSFKQLFSELTSESLRRLLLVSSLHPPGRYCENNAAANTNCRLAPA